MSTMCDQTCHRELEGEAAIRVSVGLAPATTSSGVATGDSSTNGRRYTSSAVAVESCVLLALLSACILNVD